MICNANALPRMKGPWVHTVRREGGEGSVIYMTRSRTTRGACKGRVKILPCRDCAREYVMVFSFFLSRIVVRYDDLSVLNK